MNNRNESNTVIQLNCVLPRPQACQGSNSAGRRGKDNFPTINKNMHLCTPDPFLTLFQVEFLAKTEKVAKTAKVLCLGEHTRPRVWWLAPSPTTSETCERPCAFVRAQRSTTRASLTTRGGARAPRDNDSPRPRVCQRSNWPGERGDATKPD